MLDARAKIVKQMKAQSGSEDLMMVVQICYFDSREGNLKIEK